MENTDTFGSTLSPESTAESLVGPAHASADGHALVGMPELTPEEKEKLFTALLEKKELGLYHEKDLVEANGKKILVDAGNSNLGLDPETGTQLVKHASGSWLAPADKDYDKTLATVSAQGDKASPAASETNAEKDEHKALVSSIEAMVAIDAGSSDPHAMMDAKALQRIREGASTMELKTLAPIVAAVDKFAASGAADVNPEMLGQMHPPPIVQGAAYQAAMQAKAKRNEEFMATLVSREKDSKKS